MATDNKVDDTTPFLEKGVAITQCEGNEVHLRVDSSLLSRPDPGRRRWTIAHLLLIAAYSTIAIVIIGKYNMAQTKAPHTCSAMTPQHQIYSPAEHALKYQVSTIDTNGNPYKSKYAGNPSPELDEAWSGLLRSLNMRLPLDDLTRINKTSLPLADGSGDYWASMEVFHHLHCLKMIRHWIAIEHYPEDLQKARFTLESGALYPEHIDHCIEALRAHLVCRPDISLWTYHWSDAEGQPKPDHDGAHSCADWDALEEWAHQRSFSVADGLIAAPDGTIVAPP